MESRPPGAQSTARWRSARSTRVRGNVERAGSAPRRANQAEFDSQDGASDGRPARGPSPWRGARSARQTAPGRGGEHEAEKQLEPSGPGVGPRREDRHATKPASPAEPRARSSAGYGGIPTMSRVARRRGPPGPRRRGPEQEEDHHELPTSEGHRRAGRGSRPPGARAPTGSPSATDGPGTSRAAQKKAAGDERTRSTPRAP